MDQQTALQKPRVDGVRGRPANCNNCGKPKTDNPEAKEKCECGRPTKFTETVIQKLKESFALGSSVEEACFYAEIAVSTYYDWIEKNPTLSEEFERLKQKPVLMARKEVVSGLANDKHFSLTFLKHKRPQEFGDTSTLRVEHTRPSELGMADPEFEEIRRKHRDALVKDLKKSIKRRAELEREKKNAIVAETTQK